MLEPLGDDAQRERLNACEGRFLRFTVREGAGEFDDLGQPATVILPFELNLERDKADILESRVYDASCLRRARRNLPNPIGKRLRRARGD